MNAQGFKMKKIILLIIIGILVMCFPAKTQKKDTIPKVKQQLTLTDSTPVISLRDLKAFNEWLQSAYSYTAYKTLTPEITISELWNWWLKQPKNETKKPAP